MRQISIVLLLVLCITSLFAVTKTLPDFKQYKSISERKTAFFSFIKPIIVEENKLIAQDRDFMLSFKYKFENKMDISPKDVKRFKAISKRYKVNSEKLADESFWASVNKRIDIIPVELAVIQAAIESGWGTSGFAIQGNNLFGVWTFQKGTGIVPKERAEGATHEVRVYKSINASIASYMLNLNTNRAYKKLRELRWQLRENSKALDASVICEGLVNYSQLKGEYVTMLKKMIRNNSELINSIK
jgi:Bax protein